MCIIASILIWNTFKTFFKTLLLLIPVAATAQSNNVTTQNFFWLRYYNKLSIKENIELHTEFETRRFVNPDRQHQWVVPRLHLHYKPNEVLDLGVGAVYFLQAVPQDNEDDVKEVRKEIRPHQEVSLRYKYDRFSLSHRYKVEERFFLESENSKAAFVMRFRYRLQFQFPLGQSAYVFKLYDEVMFNAGKEIVYNVFDQNRVYGGIVKKLSKQWSAELGYMHWYQQRPSGHDFYSRHIARFTLTHSLQLKHN